MHKAKVTSVDGHKVMADGRWLKPIGNKTVAVGDWVWTDGKCIYGHDSESSGNCYVSSSSLSGIPILVSKYTDGIHTPHYMYYGKGRLHDFGQGRSNKRMVNNGNRFAFLKDDGTIDGDIDRQGNVYTLEYQQIFCDWDSAPSHRFYNNPSGGACVKLNGEIFKTYDYLPCILPYVEEAMAEAEALAQPVMGEEHGSYTRLTTFYTSTWSGKVDPQGKFQVLVNARIEAEHIEHAVSMEGRDGYGFGNRSTCEVNTWFTFDGEEKEDWFVGYTTSWHPYSYPSGAYGGNDGWQSEDFRYAPAGSFRLALHDGFYATVEDLENFVKEWAFKDNCILHVYNARNEHLFSFAGNPGRNLSVCPVGTGKYLYGYPGRLYLWDNGEISEVVRDHSNYRIRRMPNIRKWKRTAGGIG